MVVKHSQINIDLNSLDVHINKRCELCKRKFPETVLNIEGHIHHGADYVCLDHRSCKRARRKLKTQRGKNDICR